MLSFGLAAAASNGFTLTSRGSYLLLGFYSPFTRSWEFAAGALLALALVKGAPQSPRLMSALGFIGLGVLTASLWLIDDRTPFPGTWTLLPVGATLLLILSGTSAHAPTTRFLSTAPMVKIGDWSYSIYLWHWPLVALAAVVWPRSSFVLVLAAIGSLLPALISYYAVEQPLRSLVDPGRRFTTLLVGLCVGVPLVLAVSLWLGAQFLGNHVYGHFAIPFKADHGGSSCFWDGSDDVDIATPCLLNTEWQVAKPVFLFGDSEAHQFFEGVRDSTRALRRPLAVATAGACPPWTC